MPRKVWVSTISSASANGPTVQANLAKACDLLELACMTKPDIVCLPEVFTSHGVPRDGVAAVAESVPGPITEAIGAIARRHSTYVICPLIERREDRFYNSAAVLDRRGRIVGVYEKAHPVPQVEDELTPGSGPKPLDTDFGRIGVLICFDINWPDAWATLKHMGAEVVFVVNP